MKQIAINNNEIKTLNESYHFELNSIYVSVPKTGSTTMRCQVGHGGKPWIHEPHLTLHQLKSLLYPYVFLLNIGQNHGFPNNNNVTDKEVFDFSEELFNKMFKFGAVRNPWARTYSLYTRDGGERKETFSEFVKNVSYASDTCVYPFKTKSQLEWFTDHDGNILADYIFKIEELDSAAKDVEELTNGKIQIKPWWHMNKVNEIDAYKKVYSDEDKKIIGKVFERDIDHFKYTF